MVVVPHKSQDALFSESRVLRLDELSQSLGFDVNLIGPYDEECDQII